MSEVAEKKVFSSKKKFRFITVDDQEYVVEQMSGRQMEEYREAMQKRFEVNADDSSKSMLTSIAGVYQDLFNRCMYKVAAGSSREKLSGNETELWSDECCQEVFLFCQEVNGLNEAGRDEAKKG